jgi:hypothetical protein
MIISSIANYQPDEMGVCVRKEFRGAPKGTNRLLAVMFTLVLIGLVVITGSKVM